MANKEEMMGTLSERIVLPGHFPDIEGWIAPDDAKEFVDHILYQIGELNLQGKITGLPHIRKMIRDKAGDALVSEGEQNG